MRSFSWDMPVEVHFGSGVSKRVVADLDGRSCVVLAFDQAFELGLQTTWTRQLGPALRGWIPAPSGPATAASARQVAQHLWPLLQAQPDAVLVGVGGGTVMDLAKLLRAVPLGLQFDDLAAALNGQTAWPAHKRTDLWLVPTTAGTGKEVNRWATLHETVDGTVMAQAFDEPSGWANRAYIDPWLAATCPQALTRKAALLSLKLALESLWSPHAHPMGESLGLSAASRIINTLPAVLADPYDLQLRGELSMAALHAGLACSQMRFAQAHAPADGADQAAGRARLGALQTQGRYLVHNTAATLPDAWIRAVGTSAHVDRLLASLFRSTALAGAAELSNWLVALEVPAHSKLDLPSPLPAIKPAWQSRRTRRPWVGQAASDLFTV